MLWNLGYDWTRWWGQVTSIYPDLREEMTPLINLVNMMNLSTYINRGVYSVETPEGKESTVRAFGLNGQGHHAVWLFDDDFTHTWDYTWGTSGRSYTDNQKESKSGHILIIDASSSASYTIKRYNTWTGKFESTSSIMADVNGKLKIPIGIFCEDPSNGAITWDGADVFLLIEPMQTDE